MGLARWEIFLDLMHKHDPESILNVTPRGRTYILKPKVDSTNKHIIEMKMSDKTKAKKRGGGNRGGGFGGRRGGYGGRSGSYGSSGYNGGHRNSGGFNHHYSPNKPVIGQMNPAPNPKQTNPQFGGPNWASKTSSSSKGYQAGGSAKYIPPGAKIAQSPPKATPSIQPGPVTGPYPKQLSPQTIGTGPVKVR